MTKTQLRRTIIKFAPLALTMIAAAGTAATGYFAAKAGYKSVDRLKSAEKNKGAPLTLKEKVEEVGAMFIPAVCCGVLTIGSTVGSYAVGRKINIGLGTAYLAAKHEYKRYSDEVREEYGEEAHAKILAKMAMPGAERAKDVPVYAYHGPLGMACDLDFHADEEKRTFLDAWSGKYFVSTINKVMAAEAHLNRNFQLGCEESVEEWYEFIGIDPPEKCKSTEYGWVQEDELCWIDFNHYKMTTDDGFECYVIEFAWEPYPYLCDDYLICGGETA